MANKEGNIPLHVAVLHRKSDVAIKLLEANPRCAHMLNVAMQSPFYIAVRDGLTHVVKKIANQGLSVDSVSTHGTALHQAVVGDNVRALEILLDKYVELVESTDSSGNNALHYAAQYNNARIVSILLKKNSTLAYKQNSEQHTPLHVAANYGSTKAAKELLKQFPDVIEKVDIVGQNAVHIAVINGNVKMLELLLKYVLPEGIVNKPDRDGNTPLHHGARLCRLQPTLLLLNDPRVNPSLLNHGGYTAFALSRRAVIMEVNADEMELWKELKKHSSRSKQRRVTTEKFQLQWRRSPHIDLRRKIIVATLMSMATFASTLTMPGGYSRQSGTAIVGHHEAFKIFVVCNTISMCGSIVLVLCFLLGWRDPGKVKVSMLIWADRLIIFSALAMIMSMLTAVYLTIAPASQWVAYVVTAIGVGTPFLVFWKLLKLWKGIQPIWDGAGLRLARLTRACPIQIGLARFDEGTRRFES